MLAAIFITENVPSTMPKMQKQNEIPKQRFTFNWQKEKMCLLQSQLQHQQRYYEENLAKEIFFYFWNNAFFSKNTLNTIY